MPEKPLSSCIYFGRVAHRRLRPVAHTFTYGMWCVLADLEELPRLAARTALFSFNRRNIISLFERDHGPRDGSPLRPWIDQHLSAAGIDLEGGPVRLLCFPRLFGYAFNPLSIWFCHDSTGALMAVMLQVSNLSGEWHNYLVRVGESSDRIVSASFVKRFSVSAFTAMDARYRCSIIAPDEKFEVCVREFEDQGETLVATWVGDRSALKTSTLLYALVRYPLLTFSIWGAIYWEALRLVRKGVPRQAQLPRPGVDVTYAVTPIVQSTGPEDDPASDQVGGRSGSFVNG